MKVAFVKPIQVNGLPGTLTGAAKGYFPQPADLMKNQRDLPGEGVQHHEISLFNQDMLAGQESLFPPGSRSADGVCSTIHVAARQSETSS